MKTVLITGCSSGYGLETARHFHAHGWNVIASMRTPREGLLPRSEQLRVLPLNVTKPESIAAALEASGPINVLVNNAGIGLIGAIEATPMAKAQGDIRDQHVRRDGHDAGGTAAVPRPQVGCGGERNVERDFGTNATGVSLHREQDGDRRLHWIARARASRLQRACQTGRAGLRPDHAIHAKLRHPHGRCDTSGVHVLCGTHPRCIRAASCGDDEEADVAEAVWCAANDMSGQLRYPAGPDAVALAQHRQS